MALNTVNWTILLSNISFDSAIGKFYDVVDKILNVYVLVHKISNSSFPRWFGANLCKLI